MKTTPTERAALTRAATIKPMDPAQAHALADQPDIDTFARRHDRRQLAETYLAWAAEEYMKRKDRSEMYHRALANRHRPGLIGQSARDIARDYRPSPFDKPIRMVRWQLTSRHRWLIDAEAAEWRLL